MILYRAAKIRYLCGIPGYRVANLYKTMREKYFFHSALKSEFYIRILPA